MRIIFPFLFVLMTSCSSGKERIFVGCTPADNIVRSFLGILSSDSVEFIRWWITIEDEKYILKCNYGVGKPNTPGFWNGGKWIELIGKLMKEGNYFSFGNENRVLKALEINPGLLHLLDEDKNLLVGTGGFGYTLSNNKISATDQVNITSKRSPLKDSMIFYGRTPCGDFSINRPGSNCIKMKWSIVFYANTANNEPTTYLVNRSNAMPLQYPGKTGTWKIITGKDGRVIYQLNPDNDNTPTYLLKLDDNILAFTDVNGNLLIGDEDFSFTISRKR